MMSQKGSGDAGDHKDNAFNCEICNITFGMTEAYFAHICSISHLQRANAIPSQPSFSNVGDVASVKAGSGEKCHSRLVSCSPKPSDAKPETNVLGGSDKLHLSGNPEPGNSPDFPQPGVTSCLPEMDIDLGKIPLPGETGKGTVPDHSKSLFSSDVKPSCTTIQESVGKAQISDEPRGAVDMETAPQSGALSSTAQAVPLPFGTTSVAPGSPATVAETLPENSTTHQTFSSTNSSCIAFSKAGQASLRTAPIAVASRGTVSSHDQKSSSLVGMVAITPSVAAPVAKAEPKADEKPALAKFVDEKMIKKELPFDAMSSTPQPFPKLLPQLKVEEVSGKMENTFIQKPETDTKSSVVKPLLSPGNTGASAPKIPGTQRTVPYLYEPAPPLKLPLLPSPDSGFIPNSGFEPWNNSGTGIPGIPLLEPEFHHGSRIPLLRSPASPYGSFPPTFPTPGGAYFSGPLLPTPARGPARPRFDPQVPAALGSRTRPPRHWGSENTSVDPVGIEVRDYHHGYSKNVGSRTFQPPQRETEHYMNPATSHMLEPLINGSNWIPRTKSKEEPKMDYTCQVCDVKYDDDLMYELHMAGQRHRQMIQSSFRKPLLVSSEPKASAFKADEDAESACHSPAFVTGLLDARRGSLPPTTGVTFSSPSSSSSSSGCFSELEKKLQVHSGPILGIDYLTEYRYLSGRLERTCDLCDVNLESVSSAVQHISSIEHLLQFMCYNNPETYRTVAVEAVNADEVRRCAEEISKTSSRQSRVRVKMESDDVSLDGRFSWIELKDSSVKPIAVLPGHRLSCGYATVAPRKSTISINDIYSLLRTVSLHSCLSANRPPSLTRPFRRIDFLNALGKFEIRSCQDAEICLQLANFLTIAVISFRRQMLPSLNAVDVTSIEEKLKNLHKSAKVVAAKTISAVSANEISVSKLEATNERSV